MRSIVSPEMVIQGKVHYHFILSNQIIDEFVEEIKKWGVIFKQYPFNSKNNLLLI